MIPFVQTQTREGFINEPLIPGASRKGHEGVLHMRVSLNTLFYYYFFLQLFSISQFISNLKLCYCASLMIYTRKESWVSWTALVFVPPFLFASVSLIHHEPNDMLSYSAIGCLSKAILQGSIVGFQQCLHLLPDGVVVVLSQLGFYILLCSKVILLMVLPATFQVH